MNLLLLDSRKFSISFSLLEQNSNINNKKSLNCIFVGIKEELTSLQFSIAVW